MGTAHVIASVSMRQPYVFWFRVAGARSRHGCFFYVRTRVHEPEITRFLYIFTLPLPICLHINRSGCSETNS